MKKQLWIIGEREGDAFKEIAKFPFNVHDLRLLNDFCEQIYDNYPEYKESGMIADKLEKLIKELEK